MRLKLILVLFIFILSIFSIGKNLEKPFWGEHDWNGVRYGNIARNFLRYGVVNLRFAQVENSGPLENKELVYYTHYPPLLPIIISLSYKIFGVSEFSTRLVPVVLTSGSVSLIFLIGSLLFGIRVGLLSSLIALLTPMTLYFGKNASHEPLTLFFILLSFYGYLLYKRRVKYALAIFIIGIILAEMSAWAGYFLVPAITIVAFFKKDFRELKFILPLWFLSIFMFLVHLIIVNLATGSFSGGNLLESLLQRSAISVNVQPENMTLFGYFNRLRLWFSTTFTLTLTSLSIIWFIFRIKEKFKERDFNLLDLSLVGLIYLFVFSNAAFIHNYLIFYFLPFLSLSSASLLFSLKKINRLKSFYPIIILALLFLIVRERRNFLVALNNSQQDKLAVQIGKEINSHTNSNKSVLISPSEFGNSADNFLKFYSDRQIKYIDDGDYSVQVLVDQENQKFEIIKKD